MTLLMCRQQLITLIDFLISKILQTSTDMLLKVTLKRKTFLTNRYKDICIVGIFKIIFFRKLRN